MRRHIILLAAGAVAIGALASPSAFAQPRRHVARVVTTNEAPPLTITRRSFLDMGKQVPVGTYQQYVYASTYWNSNVATSHMIDHFGGFQNLPGRFGIGGREEPLFTFSTGNGGP